MADQSISDLDHMLDQLNPHLNPGEFVFCTIESLDQLLGVDYFSMIRETEGISVILSKHQADSLKFDYSTIMVWITLEVYSSLESVGLTATISTAFAENNISCNVVAGYHHDHIFVPVSDGQKAIEILRQLSNH